MSWSHNFNGPALEVAQKVELAAAGVSTYLANCASTGNPKFRSGYEAERALHARVVAIVIAACHEGKEHAVKVEAFGNFDGKHNHVTLRFDGIDTPVAEEPTEGPKPGRKRQKETTATPVV